MRTHLSSQSSLRMILYYYCMLCIGLQARGWGVKCVTGDAYRYTIQPVFENTSGQRRCHIRRRRDTRRDVLYEVFYYVQLPAAVVAAAGGTTGFKTPRVRRIIRPTDGELTGVDSGSSHRVDFLNVEHDAGLELQVLFAYVTCSRRPHRS